MVLFDTPRQICKHYGLKGSSNFKPVMAGATGILHVGAVVADWAGKALRLASAILVGARVTHCTEFWKEHRLMLSPLFKIHMSYMI